MIILRLVHRIKRKEESIKNESVFIIIILLIIRNINIHKNAKFDLKFYCFGSKCPAMGNLNIEKNKFNPSKDKNSPHIENELILILYQKN